MSTEAAPRCKPSRRSDQRRVRDTVAQEGPRGQRCGDARIREMQRRSSLSRLPLKGCHGRVPTQSSFPKEARGRRKTPSAMEGVAEGTADVALGTRYETQNDTHVEPRFVADRNGKEGG